MRRRVAAFAALGLLALGVWLLSPPGLQALGDFLVVRDPLRPADAVIAVSGDGSGERVRTAGQLVTRGDVRWLILSGSTAGAFPGGATQAMLRVALAAGVPPERILLDEQSHSTQENARAVATLMQARQLRRAILVTSPYHTRRAAWIFRREFGPRGLELRVMAAADSFFNVHRWWTRQSDRALVLREYVKLLAFLVGVR